MAWDMLMDPKYSILRRAIFTTRSERTRFRKFLINAVLATDIADPDLRRNRKERWDRAFHNKNRHLMTAKEAANVKATIVYEQIIIASDVSHTMQHWHIYQKWNQRLYAEKYRAFLAGREPKHPKLGWNGGTFFSTIAPFINICRRTTLTLFCHYYSFFFLQERFGSMTITLFQWPRISPSAAYSVRKTRAILQMTLPEYRFCLLTDMLLLLLL